MAGQGIGRFAPMADQETRFEVRRTVESLQLVGEVDLSNVGTLRDALQAELDEDRGLVVDLSRCSYLGSEGIGALIEVWNRTRGPLVLRDPTPQVRRALEVAGITRFPRLVIEDSRG